MPPEERAAQVAELFDSAIECETSERAAFLDQRCGADAELRAEVESLLNAAKRADDFLDRSPLEALAEPPPTGGAFAAGDVVGSYEIVSLIGRGGMGEVYLASDQRVRRQVALKLVRGGLDRETLTRRFQREQELLAALNHPNIAQLYETGVTPDGIPFFAMEYVAGTRLDEFVAQRPLNLPERLTLFRKICSAIAYAHQHLVVHRDIKPANIRVTPEGEPKLFDFGIAKLLDEMAEDAPEQTLTMQRMLTPEYASPEQVRGDRISTASDVYSLGVVLYELLTGAKPYRLTSRSSVELERAITQHEPIKPSENRESKIENRKSLRGDLDNIVLMALRKEPERRYASVSALSDDIARFLDGRPIRARKDSVGYRAAKFVQRNRVAVAAAVVVTVAILAALAIAVFEAEKTRRQRDLTARINTFLQRMLSFSNQSASSVSPVAQRKNVSVNEMLDQITPQVEAELADEPAVRGQVLRTIGSAYASQGRYEAAEKNLRAALAVQSAASGKTTAEGAATMMELGVLSYRQAKYQEAADLLEKAVAFYRDARQRRSASNDPAQLALALDYLGIVRFYQGDTKGALPMLREASAISCVSSLPANHSTVCAFNKVDLGGVLLYSGQLDEGEKLIDEAVAEYRRLPGPPRWELGGALLVHGMLQMTRKQYAEADKDFRESEHVLRETLGDSNSYLASVFDCEAQLCVQQNNLDCAEKRVRESLRMLEASLSPGSLPLAAPLSTLGDVVARLGRTAEAEGYYRRALAIAEQQPVKNFFVVSRMRTLVAYSLLAQNRLDEAEAAAAQAVAEAHDHLEPNSVVTKTVEAVLAAIQQARAKTASH